VLEICAVDPVPINIQYISEIGGAEGKILLSNQSGDDLIFIFIPFQ